MAKKLNTNSNAYIIVYSMLLVVIVAFCLAFVYTSLKERQDANVALDVKKQVLAALDIREFADDAEAEAKYLETVVKTDTVDVETRKVVYTCDVNGVRKYILYVKGMGLWGPIWGYIALDADKTTVFGAFFNHEGETAGLGAEIKDSRNWQQLFKGKKAYVAGQPVLGVKKATDIRQDEKQYNVDAVTGATLTSDGVNLMLKDYLAGYSDFLNQIKD